jgi:signal peptide peptidase SppA
MVKSEMKLWAGSPESYEDVLTSLSKLDQLSESEVQKRLDDFNESYDPEGSDHYALTMEDGVAIITVAGSMVSGTTSWWGPWLGVIGYEDIKEAILCGIENNANKFIFDWDTPGGSVAGIEEMSNFIKDLSKQYITVSYTSGTCCSAGIWLATATDEFYASKMAQVGSIGVIAVHREFTEMMKMEGVTPTVLRSAPYKALGNPYEKLSDKAKAKIEEDIKTAHGFFVEAIAENCGLSLEYVGETIATGEVWYGQGAKDRGLIDAVKPYGDVFGELVAADPKESEMEDGGDNEDSVASPIKKLENTGDYVTNTPEVGMKRKKITEQAQAAIASGVPVDVAMADAPIEDEVEEETLPTDVPEESEADVEGESSEASASTGVDIQLVDQLVAAKVALATAEAKVANMEGSHNAMKAVVVTAIQRAHVGMGGTAPSTESLMSMDASVLVQQHAEAQAQLDKRFGIGSRMSVDVDESSEEDVATSKIAAYNESVLLNLARFKK